MGQVWRQSLVSHPAFAALLQRQLQLQALCHCPGATNPAMGRNAVTSRQVLGGMMPLHPKEGPHGVVLGLQLPCAGAGQRRARPPATRPAAPHQGQDQLPARWDKGNVPQSPPIISKQLHLYQALQRPPSPLPSPPQQKEIILFKTQWKFKAPLT